MHLYYPVDLAGNVNIIEKLVLGGTGTGADLPIRAACGRAGLPTGRADTNYLQRAGPNIRTGRAGRAGKFRPVTVILLVFITVFISIIFY